VRQDGQESVMMDSDDKRLLSKRASLRSIKKVLLMLLIGISFLTGFALIIWSVVHWQASEFERNWFRYLAKHFTAPLVCFGVGLNLIFQFRRSESRE
jgi:hypothetical protein